MKGYDYKIIDDVRKTTSLPMTVLGGAGSLDDLGNLIKKYSIIGAGAGSLFVFKGKYRAVLINYPNQKEKNRTNRNIYGLVNDIIMKVLTQNLKTGNTEI